jgi:flagellar hook-associated protein 2
MASSSGLATLGNRTFFFGGASGIDTKSLIEAGYQQRKREADKIDAQITTNTSKYEAYDKIRSLSNDIKSSLSNIKKNYSTLASNTGLFDQRTGSLTSSSSTIATALVSAAIDPGTDLGSFSLEVMSKAKVQKTGSNAAFADRNADLGYAGTFDISIAGKTASTINVTADMSLAELATAINSQSSTTGVNASVIQASPTSFQLVLTGTDTAKAITINNVTGTDVMQSIGVTNGAGGFTNPIQAATQAEVKIDNVSYFRDTNNFDDVIPGVKLTVKNAEPGNIIDLSIENNNSGIKDGIKKFVDTYNELRDYIKGQQVVSEDGAVDSDAILYGDTLLSSLNLSLQSIIGGSYGSGGTTLSTLRDVGITLDADNKLVMDESKFDTAVIDKFDEVRAIFETKVTSSNTEFRMTKNQSLTSSLAFSMDITMSGSSISSVSVGGDNSLFTVSGNTITGNAGTVYEGMTFAYVGTTNTTVNIDIRGGISDSMDLTLNNFSDKVNGDFTNEMLRITDENVRLSQRSTRVIERAEAYRNRLIDQYAAFETKLSAAQSTLAQLRSLLGTNKNDD